MYAATLIFTSLNAAERHEVCQFMREHRALSLACAVMQLFEVCVVNGEDIILPRELPLPRLPFPPRIICCTPDDSEELPF